jgi:kumamolisin
MANVNSQICARTLVQGFDGDARETDRQEMDDRYVALVGSERSVAPGARRIGPADPDERLQVTLVLRVRPGVRVGSSPVRLNRAEFALTEGALPEDIELARTFAVEFGLRVTRISTAERTVVLSGSAGSFSRAFRIDLGRYELGPTTYRGREGSIHLPRALAHCVVAVLGLDDRPAAEHR